MIYQANIRQYQFMIGRVNYIVSIMWVQSESHILLRMFFFAGAAVRFAKQ